MKHLILAILMIFILKFPILAQENKKSGIYFGAIIGTKINYFERHFIADIKPELYSFSIGAGSAWTKNNYIIGFEFIYSSANKENNIGDIQYIGFTNTLSFGYNLSKNKSWIAEPTIGLVLNNNQLIAIDKKSDSFQNLLNNQFATNIGFNFKIIDKNGLFTGIKIGFILPFSNENEWINKISESDSGLEDNIGSFYIQLNLGGLLKLN